MIDLLYNKLLLIYPLIINGYIIMINEWTMIDFTNINLPITNIWTNDINNRIINDKISSIIII